MKSSRKSGGSASTLRKRARRISLLLMDVDGVLTDGRIWLHSEPDGTATEIKGFSAYDGAGLKMASACGLRTGVITGRESAAVTRRAREAEIEFVYQGQAEKTAAFEEILRKAGVSESEVAYIGDDLPDLPILTRAGLAIAVANAVPEVKKVAQYVTKTRGGDGAAREAVELILKAQSKWAQAIRESRA